MTAKSANKGVAWLYSEVCALLDIWADQDVQLQLSGRLHNMCVYEKISKRLTDLGIDRSGEQCREKIKKLRRDYKTVVDNNYSPAFARKLLGCYDKVHEIFGKCAVVKPSFVIESVVYNDSLNKDTDKKIPEEKNESSEQSGSKEKINTENPKATEDVNKNSKLERKSHYSQARNPSKVRNKKMKIINNHLKKQAILHEKLSRRQASLQKKFAALQKKQFNSELIQEREKLKILEEQRRKEKEQEIELFKGLLHAIAAKQGVQLTLE